MSIIARYVQHGFYSQIRYVYSGILMVSETTKHTSVVFFLFLYLKFTYTYVYLFFVMSPALVKWQL